MNAKSEIARLIVLMQDFRQFPKYQLERRLDIFIALFLPEFLSATFGGAPVEIMAPEFPLKKDGSRASVNADYLLYRGGDKPAWIILELKTCEGSLGASQCEKYLAAARKGMRGLLEEIREIKNGSGEASKYEYLLGKFSFPERLEHPVEVVYLSPCARESLGGEFAGMLGADTIRWITLAEFCAWEPREGGELWVELKRLLLQIPSAVVAGGRGLVEVRACPACGEGIQFSGSVARSRRSLDVHLTGAHKDIPAEARRTLILEVFPDIE